MSKDLITGAEALMRSLEHQGVNYHLRLSRRFNHAYIYDALYDHQNTLNHILVRHEQGAAHAAQGYARVSGKVGVCLGDKRSRSYQYDHRYCRCDDR